MIGLASVTFRSKATLTLLGTYNICYGSLFVVHRFRATLYSVVNSVDCVSLELDNDWLTLSYKKHTRDLLR